MATINVRERSVKTVPISEAEAHWPEILDAAGRGEERVIVERDGGDVALVSTDDLRRLIAWEAERRDRFAPLYETQQIFAGTSDDELEREVELAIAQVRGHLQRQSSNR